MANIIIYIFIIIKNLLVFFNGGSLVIIVIIVGKLVILCFVFGFCFCLMLVCLFYIDMFLRRKKVKVFLDRMGYSMGYSLGFSLRIRYRLFSFLTILGDVVKRFEALVGIPNMGFRSVMFVHTIVLRVLEFLKWLWSFF